MTRPRIRHIALTTLLAIIATGTISSSCNRKYANAGAKKKAYKRKYKCKTCYTPTQTYILNQQDITGIQNGYPSNAFKINNIPQFDLSSPTKHNQLINSNLLHTHDLSLANIHHGAVGETGVIGSPTTK